MKTKIGDKFKIMEDHPYTRTVDLREGSILSVEFIYSNVSISFKGGWSGYIEDGKVYLGGLDNPLKKVKPTRLELQEQIDNLQENIDDMQSQIHLLFRYTGINKKSLDEVNNSLKEKVSIESTKEVVEIDAVGELPFMKYTKSCNWGNPPTEAVSELKTLGQDVFVGLDEKYIFAAVDDDGRGTASNYTLDCLEVVGCWANVHETKIAEMVDLGKGFDATNWKGSLIKRESKELTGSDLCRAMLLRGEKVICDVNDGVYELIISYDSKSFIDYNGLRYNFVTPVDYNGNPLTAKQVGL